MADGDEIQGDVGENGRTIGVGKDISQRTNTGGGATVHLQGNSDTLSSIFYHLSSINGKIERYGDKLDGHDNRLTALEGRMTRQEGGERRHVIIEPQTAVLFLVIFFLAMLSLFLLIERLSGTAGIIIPITQWFQAAVSFLPLRYVWTI